MVTQDTIIDVDAALVAHYGAKRWRGPGDPLGGLVATILSQSTTDANSSAAFATLRERFPVWDEVAGAPVESIAGAIRSGGLADQKAGRIKSILLGLREERGELSLGFLADMPLRDAGEYLEQFKGVGPKTAACVLLFSLGRPAFPIDTHVWRIVGRLGWLPQGTNAKRAHDLLTEAVPDDICYQLHMNLVAHGRTLCRPRGPKCDECPISRECKWLAQGD